MSLEEVVFGEAKHQAEVWVGLGSPRRSPYFQSLPRRSEAPGGMGGGGDQPAWITSAWRRHLIKVSWLDWRQIGMRSLTLNVGTTTP